MLISEGRNDDTVIVTDNIIMDTKHHTKVLPVLTLTLIPYLWFLPLYLPQARKMLCVLLSRTYLHAKNVLNMYFSLSTLSAYKTLAVGNTHCTLSQKN